MFRLLLQLFPSSFRDEYGDEVLEFLRLRTDEVKGKRGWIGVVRLWSHNIRDLLLTAFAEHHDRPGEPRNHRGDNAMRTLLDDIRYVLRTMRRNFAFTATAVLTLSLGVGGTTAIFSVVDTLMLEELPYPNAEQIVTVWQNDTHDGNPREDVAPANFIDWQEQNQIFEAMAAAEPYSMDLTNEGPPETLYGVLVTEGFFDILRVQPHLGRLFQSSDYRGDVGRVVVLTYSLWQSRFGGDPDIVGRVLTLDGDPSVVVGILPREFELNLLPGAGERGLWAPRTLQGWEREARDSTWWQTIARMKPGITIEHARTDMSRVAGALAQTYPDTNEGIGVTVLSLREHLVGSARPGILLLLGSVVFVLLIACANIASLLLARGTERESEFALRSALGARRSTLVRLTVTESLVLSLMGAAIGLAIAFWGVDVIRGMASGQIPRIDSISLDFRVFGFGLVLSLGSAILFGTVPAVRLSRPQAVALKEGRGTAGSSRGRGRGALIVIEAALALALLIGAGLLLRSFIAVTNVDPGFRTQGVLALQLFAWRDGEVAQDRVGFFNETIDRIRALPNVESVGAVSAAPFLEADVTNRRTFTIEGKAPQRAGVVSEAFVNYATPALFETLEIPLLRGRPFRDSDRFGAPLVAIINETARDRFWHDTDPIGDMIRIGESAPTEVVGVVSNVRNRGLDTEPRPEIFRPHAQNGTGSMTYFVSARGHLGTALQAVQQAVWTVDPLQAFYRTATVEELVSKTLATRRFILLLVGGFASVAILMAAVGIYGVMSFAVNRQTHDIGIRIALGAGRAQVVRLVVRDGMRLASIGGGIGLFAAWAGSSVLSSFLFEVSVRDSLTFASAAILLLVVAWLASYLPARRATHVDPLVALKHE